LTISTNKTKEELIEFIFSKLEPASKLDNDKLLYAKNQPMVFNKETTIEDLVIHGQIIATTNLTIELRKFLGLWNIH
jgi:hypothetical protein